MAFIPVANTARVAMTAYQDAQQLNNVFFFKKTAGGVFSVADLTDLVASVKEEWDNYIAPLQAAGLQYSLVVARAMDTASSPAVEESYTTAGSDNTGELPTNVTWCIKWNTGLSGKSFRGRTYHLGLTPHLVSNSQMILSFADTILEAYNDWHAAMTTAGYALQVVSFFTGGAPRTNGLATPVTNASYADLALDSQRRRLPTRGA